MARPVSSFPYPIISSSDDTSTIFEIYDVSVEYLSESVEVQFNALSDDETLASEIEQGHALLACRVRCAQTFLLTQIVPELLENLGVRKRYILRIPNTELMGRVQVNLLVVATTEIAAYRPLAQHSDYGDTKFSMFPGDVMAVSGTIEFHVGKLFDRLKPPSESFFRVIEDSTVTGGIKLDFASDDYVYVRVATPTFQALSVFAGKPGLQTALVVFPALVATLEAISAAKDDADAFEGKAWVDDLQSLVAAYDIADIPAIEQAQRILEDPLQKALEEIGGENEDDEEAVQ